MLGEQPGRPPWAAARGAHGGFPFLLVQPQSCCQLCSGLPVPLRFPAHIVTPMPTLPHLRMALPGASSITPNLIYTQLASYLQNIKNLFQVRACFPFRR